MSVVLLPCNVYDLCGPTTCEDLSMDILRFVCDVSTATRTCKIVRPKIAGRSVDVDMCVWGGGGGGVRKRVLKCCNGNA